MDKLSSKDDDLSIQAMDTVLRHTNLVVEIAKMASVALPKKFTIYKDPSTAGYFNNAFRFRFK